MDTKTIATLLVVLIALGLSIPVLKKKLDVSEGYWVKTIVFSALSFGILAALGLYNLFFYFCAVLVLVLMVRWVSEEFANPKFGSLFLGMYFGLWLSLPIGVYSYGT